MNPHPCWADGGRRVSAEGLGEAPSSPHRCQRRRLPPVTCCVGVQARVPLRDGASCPAAASCRPPGSITGLQPAPDAGDITAPAPALAPGMLLPSQGSASKSQRSAGRSGELRRPSVLAVAGDSRLAGVGGCFCSADASPPPGAPSPAPWYRYSYGQFSVFKFCETILRKISPWCCWLSSRLEIAFPCLKFLPEFQMENVQLHFPSRAAVTRFNIGGCATPQRWPRARA